MKEKPIIFSAPMVRAILEGRKTQTRRIVWSKRTDYAEITENEAGELWPWRETEDGEDFWYPCPYGQPGNRIWVKESFSPIYPQDTTYNGGQPIEYDYAATYKDGGRLGDSIGIKKAWKSSRYMPRRASRITLEITAVRVERLQNISGVDAIAEGIDRIGGAASCCPWRNYRIGETGEMSLHCSTPRRSYMTLWEQINGSGSWDKNPWVWVIEFRKVEND